jgi:DNA-binding beta-propeller fold protein YncE
VTRFLSWIVLLLLVPMARADKLVLFAGGGAEDDNVPAAKAKLNQPFGIDFDKDGNAYIVEMVGGRVLKVNPQGQLTTVAGATKNGDAGDNGPAKQAVFNGPHTLAIPPGSNDVFVADTWNGRIRKIDAKTGAIATIAGTAYLTDKKMYKYEGDGGPALQAKFSGIYCIAFTPAGDKLYITDLENRRIRVLDMKTGRLDLVAGNGQKGVPVDGATAKESPLVDPRACTVDKKGNVYILERSGHALRVVDISGKIRTVVGASGKAGLAGDGGDALQAMLNGPKHLCMDHDGNVIIADSGNHAIRKYIPTSGTIVRVAGSGRKGPSGNGGDPLTVTLTEPHGVNIHPTSGALYIVDSSNHRVFRMEK